MFQGVDDIGIKYEDSSSEPEEGFNESKFSITFSIEEWNAIKPQPRVYVERNGLRCYDVLTPYVWSNIVQEHFYLHTKLPCALTFKKAQVTVSGKYFINISGRCSTYNSIFKGIVEDVPAVNARYVINNSFKLLIDN